ncbi:MAG: phosphoenolpyruvate carboxykinase (ATP) [Anaerolineales bacterium]|nr:phosphoenolpyruvate carboxykinase (ATP) [Anaerolineales bacterium]
MGTPSRYGLDNQGLRNLNMVYWTLPTPALIERIVSRREGVLAHEGALIVRTGHHTGRAPNDKYIVKDDETTDKVAWGKANTALAPDNFESIYLRMCAYFQGRDLFVQDTAVCAHPDYRMPIRVVTENAWHSLFARNLFLRRPPEDLVDHRPEFTILQAPGFRAIPELDGTNSDIFVILNFRRRMILIGGTSYAGEMKKSIFSVLNYLLPQRGVLPMHCSANVGMGGDVALFFGLSGTGKTTLSSTPDRQMVGDDEHGWGDDGVFNFEGGCYAKVIRLRQDLEPVIWQATHHFGTVLENVNINSLTRRVDFDDDSFTENTRAAYPIGFLPNSIPSGRAGHPQNIFFLTADAFGVLPPIARLTAAQAMYYFLSGYTSKLAGTERGLGSQPQATFSTGFGAPFLPLQPRVYADLLGEKINAHQAHVWLVNTGWTGGAYGVGERISLPYTRALVAAALNGDLADVPMHTESHFGLQVPENCPGIPSEILDARGTWADPDAYDRQAMELVGRFKENINQFAEVPAEVLSAGPR